MQSTKTEVIIHLNNYASAFATEMCAYMTGEIPSFDDALPGYAEHEIFQNDKKIPDSIKDFFVGKLDTSPSEYGEEYYELISTLGWYNHGMNGLYEDIPENDEIALKDFKNKTIAYLKKMHSGKELKEKILEVEEQKHVTKYLSEQGFVISVNDTLNEELINFLENRAKEFARKNKIKILSFEVNEVSLKISKKIKKIK